MDPRLQAICDAHGVFLRGEAEDLGYSNTTISRLVRDGTWHRVRHGAYVFADAWSAADGRRRYGLLCRAGFRQSRTDVVLSHTSAANEWGAPLWDLDLGAVHLTRVDGRSGRSEAGIRQHRGHLLGEDVTKRNGLPVVSATRAALEITTIADIEHSMVEIDGLLHAGLTTIEQLRRRYDDAMTRWPDTLHTDLILRLVDGRAESVGESRSRYLCWCEGLPPPVPQLEVKDRNGNVIARVDLAWPELGVFLEFDGRVKYQRYLRPGETVTDAVLREKAREELICELTGWRCIRIVWADLYRPAETASRIRRLFRPAAA